MDVKEIICHHDTDPDENPWVHGSPPIEEIVEVIFYDSAWPMLYEKLADDIRKTLGPIVIHLEHVGSTAVPGLAAKPVIDIDLTVPDPTDEESYVSALEKLGYDHTIREPSWHEHRCLQLFSPRVNLHVFGPDCPELVRHRLFRDWLREHPEDCRAECHFAGFPRAGAAAAL